MLVIKPYGRTQTSHSLQAQAQDLAAANADSTKKARRVLLPRLPQPAPQDLRALETYADFLVAHWISVIDKIVVKPKLSKDKKYALPSQVQWQARENIGQAALQILKQKLAALDADGYEKLTKMWWSKLHPYGSETIEFRHRNNPAPKSSEPPPAETLKGRRFARFVNPDIALDAIDSKKGAQIAKVIEQYLDGHIKSQIVSIATNVHSCNALDTKPPAPETTALEATAPEAKPDAVWQAYFSRGDVVRQIYKLFERQFEERQKSKNAQSMPHKVQLSYNAQANQCLYEHYGKVFSGAKMSELAQSNHPKHAMWCLHQEIKATYKAIFDNASAKGKKLQNIKQRLPKNKEGMKTLMAQREQNQEIGQLIRLGKVIHYTAAQEGKKSRALWGDPLVDLNNKIENSGYWCSDGQAEIKRSEALVRVFKLSVTHAARTLTDLTHWSGGDIYGKSDSAIQNLLFGTTKERLEALFGRACLEFFPSEWGTEHSHLEKKLRELLKETIEVWAQLRHSSFHFKGRDGFIAQLKAGLTLDSKQYPCLDEVAQQLVQADWRERQRRIQATLEAAHCQSYLTQAQLQAVYDALMGKGRERTALDLPRLNRVLSRINNLATNAHDFSGEPVLLPEPAKRATLEEKESARCQYVLLKLLYEAHHFSAWLAGKNGKEVGRWISLALDRADKAANRINHKNSDQPQIYARARGLWSETLHKDGAPTPNSTVLGLNGMDLMAYFFSQLAAHTATEFRVQRHYESDPEQAREQAAFIDDLKCEVVGIAFSRYLKKAFDWLPKNLEKQKIASDLKALAVTETTSALENWQNRLYFLIHFVPVDAVSQLLHQLRKWHILGNKAEDQEQAQNLPAPPKNTGLSDVSGLYAQCSQVLTLYLDMHDAKFDGGKEMILTEAHLDVLKACFERSSDFEKCFPKSSSNASPNISSNASPNISSNASPNSKMDAFIPQRALREMIRFGAMESLGHVFTDRGNIIKTSEVQAFEGLQAQIEDAQKAREDLHEAWVKSGRKFERHEEYKNCLEICTQHRYLAHRLRLIDHVELHQLVMAVLMRLVDYAGLWERDLYFVTLALCYQNGVDVSQVFEGKAGDRLDDGRIVEALDQTKDKLPPEIFNRLDEWFGWNEKKGRREIRNSFSHFNMLKKGESKSLNLTYEVNQARTLMAYDRKLKNAVSKSIMERLAREGFELTWKTTQAHQLEGADLKPKQIVHLGGEKKILKTVFKKGLGMRKIKLQIKENHHSNAYCQMVLAVFKR